MNFNKYSHRSIIHVNCYIFNDLLFWIIFYCVHIQLLVFLLKFIFYKLIVDKYDFIELMLNL